MVVISDNHDITIGNKYVIDKNMIGLYRIYSNLIKTIVTFIRYQILLVVDMQLIRRQHYIPKYIQVYCHIFIVFTSSVMLWVVFL